MTKSHLSENFEITILEKLGFALVEAETVAQDRRKKMEELTEASYSDMEELTEASYSDMEVWVNKYISPLYLIPSV